MDNRSDTELVKRFRAGDIQAFQSFLERHQDRLFRIARLLLIRSELTEDAVQETCLRAFTGLGGFRFRSQPFTWLYRTLKNVCREMNRREANNTGLEQPGPVVETSTDDVDRTREFERVRRAVARLPRRQRDVVMLRLFEEYSVKETAVALGLSEGTVKTLLHRAIRRLRELPTTLS